MQSKSIVCVITQNIKCMNKAKITITVVLLLMVQSLFSQPIKVGAERMEDYLSLLDGKSVGVVANPTSRVGNTHLVDTLLSLGVDIKAIFCPEHGFRGQAEAGASINSEIDSQTGIPIVSLYGKNKKPSVANLANIDVLVFDIQDVGARFYTYISTLHYVMEAAAENGKRVVVLDRPNPNGFYVDGPVLKSEYKSFVGMHPVPIVHGMTIGEYALMINGEGWLANGVKCVLDVVTMDYYTHDSLYELPVSPSPNLRTMNAIYLYPSICCFEGTSVSVGRGTNHPFELIGTPYYKCVVFGDNITFVPKPIKGVSENPLHNGKSCVGWELIGDSHKILETKKLNLSYLIDMYKCSNDDKFFNSFFEKLMGTGELRKQIEAGLSEDEIRNSWQPALSEFKEIRKKYLLYEDFE